MGKKEQNTQHTKHEQVETKQNMCFNGTKVPLLDHLFLLLNEFNNYIKRLTVKLTL